MQATNVGQWAPSSRPTSSTSAVVLHCYIVLTGDVTSKLRGEPREGTQPGLTHGRTKRLTPIKERSANCQRGGKRTAPIVFRGSPPRNAETAFPSLPLPFATDAPLSFSSNKATGHFSSRSSYEYLQREPAKSRVGQGCLPAPAFMCEPLRALRFPEGRNGLRQGNALTKGAESLQPGYRKST